MSEQELMSHIEFQSIKPYMGLAVQELTIQEEKLVQLIVSGMSAAAAGRAAGYKSGDAALKASKRPKCQQAIQYLRNEFREEVNFTKTNAHSMYMDTWTSCANATEMKNTVDSLVKLHGLSTPDPSTQVTINVTNSKQLERMTDAELLRLTGQDIDYLEPK
jgi:hypothetical protein